MTAATGSPAAVVWLQHGFARRPHHLVGLAAALREQGLRVRCPALASLRRRRSLHDVEYLAVLADRMRAESPGVPLIGVGHSAGAAAVATAGLDRLVLLDPVDTVGGILSAAMPKLSRMSTPIAVVELAPSRCNRHGRTTAALATECAAGRLVGSVMRRPTLSHADPERIPADLRAASVAPPPLAVQLACGTGGSPSAVADLGRLAVALVTDPHLTG